MACAGPVLNPAERCFWLTRSVARVAGINLAEAMARGQLTPQGYGALVARCRAAGCQRACETWLASQTGATVAVPDHCVNADRLNALAQGRGGPMLADHPDRW